MANKGSARGSGPSQKRPPRLPDDVIDEAKNTILHGYKRPPRHTRFRKGQSGNPGGRPKKDDHLGIGGSRSAGALVLAEAERLVTVREGEETRQMPAIEAVIRAQNLLAMKGSAYAQKHVIERYDRADRERRRMIREEIDLWEWYVATQRKLIAEAERKGEMLPSPLPHPDDVAIDHERGVRFIGPIDEGQAAELHELCDIRDVLLMQDALDRRVADGHRGGNPSDEPGSALLLANMIDQVVPARYRLSDAELMLRMMDHRAMPKRELLKTLFRAWRSLGASFRRGVTFPPLRATETFLHQVFDHLHEDHHQVAGNPI